MRQRRERAHTRVAPRKGIRSGGPGLWWVPVSVFLLSVFCALFLLVQQSRWNMGRQQSFLIVSGDAQSPVHALTLITLKGEEQSVAVLPLPESLSLEVVGGYGKYRAGAVEGLRLLEKKSPDMLLQSIQFQFGIPVTDILWTDPLKQTTSREKREWIEEMAWQGASLRGRSTLGLVDRIKLYWYIRNIPQQKFTFLNLESAGIFLRGGAGESGLELDVSAFDAVAADVFRELALRQEMKTVAVVNASQETKVAAKIGRALGNMGMDVISVTTLPDARETTEVIVADGRSSESKTAEAIRRLFQLSSDRQRTNLGEAMQFRADVVLIVGKDWGTRLRTER